MKESQHTIVITKNFAQAVDSLTSTVKRLSTRIEELEKRVEELEDDKEAFCHTEKFTITPKGLDIIEKDLSL